MSAKYRCNRGGDGAQKAPYPHSSLTPATVGRSRATLLAGASLVALAALATPDRAHATCTGLDRTISSPRTGPVLSKGGAITVTGAGSILGGPSRDGVDALTCPITTLTNQSGGTISGGNGRTSAPGGAGVAGGIGVSNASTITTLTNAGAISGGKGGAGTTFIVVGAGGAGVSNASTIRTLTNSGTISGGSGFAATGGAGVSNASTITTLTNSGKIRGGNGGFDAASGAGVSNAKRSTIGSLSNAFAATISGGIGGSFGGGLLAINGEEAARSARASASAPAGRGSRIPARSRR